MVVVAGYFRPSENQKGDVVTGLSGRGALVIHNLSPWDLTFTDDYGNTRVSPAYTAIIFDICNTTPILHWSRLNQIMDTNIPTDECYIEAYQPSENLIGTYPASYPRAAAVGSTVPITPQGGAMPVSGDIGVSGDVSIAPGTEVGLVAGTQVTLPDGQLVTLPAGTQVDTTGSTVLLHPDTTVGVTGDVSIASGTEVALVAGTQVSLPDGQVVSLPAGTVVDTTGSEVGLVAGTTVGANVTNDVLPIGANAVYHTTITAGPTGSISTFFTVPDGVTGLAVNSDATVNSYSLIVLTGVSGSMAEQINESTRPQPPLRVVPVLNNGGSNSFTVVIGNNNGNTTHFDIWLLYGALSVVTTPVEGFVRQQPNITATGRVHYQANTAVSGVTTRFTINGLALQTLVIDSIWGDSASNGTNETAAYIRLQTNDATPVILWELWSPFAVKPIVRDQRVGPIYISPGVNVVCVTSNGSTAAVLQTCSVNYHYIVQ